MAEISIDISKINSGIIVVDVDLTIFEKDIATYTIHVGDVTIVRSDRKFGPRNIAHEYYPTETLHETVMSMRKSNDGLTRAVARAVLSDPHYVSRVMT
jgi:hypothetical protein